MKVYYSLLALAGLYGEANAMSARGERMKREKEAEWDFLRTIGEMPKQVNSVLYEPQECTDGVVTLDGEDFPCMNIDFEGFLSLQDSNIPDKGGSTQGSDIWGWVSPEGLEITLWCVDNGVWFIDSTVPSQMRQLGYMTSPRNRAAWCDIKVYEDVAYIIKDGPAFPTNNGIQVFDLNRLVGLSEDKTRSFEADYIFHGHGKSHNVAVDTESGFLYSVGSDQCRGGLFILDLSTPLEPVQVGCVSQDGYTHDVQCVVYDGPDTNYLGQEICFAFNEDTLTIWDVTVKSSPVMLSRETYSTARYTHQGWLSEDMKYVLMNDELDESRGAVRTTTTYVINVEDLTNPIYEYNFAHDEVSIDHNLYVWGPIHAKGWGGNPAMANPPDSRYAYLSNYVAGIKVLDLSTLPEPTLAGLFNVAPDITGNRFEGTWSNYMHPSGILAVSSIDRGLFMLKPQMAFASEKAPTVSIPTPPPVPIVTESPTCGTFFC